MKDKKIDFKFMIGIISVIGLGLLLYYLRRSGRIPGLCWQNKNHRFVLVLAILFLIYGFVSSVKELIVVGGKIRNHREESAEDLIVSLITLGISLVGFVIFGLKAGGGVCF